jgi:RHS repeat-associated protein
VQHFSGPLTEETGYCPFGLAMSGISSKAALKLENRHKYNGIEEEKALGLNVYDAQFRELDPQTGRWWQIDPKTDEMLMWSTYASNYDNPIRFADPLGDAPDEDCCGGLFGAIASAADKFMLSASGTFWGLLNTSTFGLVSTDPFNVRPGLTSEEKVYWDNGVTVGKVGAMVAPNSRGRGASEPAVEMASAGGGPNVKVKVAAAQQNVLAPPAMLRASPPSSTPTAEGNGHVIKQGNTSKKSLTEQANELVAQNGGKNSIALRTESLLIRYDLAGRSHGNVPTPHMQFYKKNFHNGNTPVIN